MEKNEVFDALEMVMEEIESVVETLREEGADAFRKDELDSIAEIKNCIEEIKKFREKVKDLQKEWKRLFDKEVAESMQKTSKRRSIGQRLERGLRTPEDYFRLPTLESLVELGGSAPMRDVLDKVFKKMESVLNEYDLQGLHSTGQPRWENTAQWCRNSMVIEGFLTADSPRGIWAISEEGRRFLSESEKGD